jgi:hypothetical protein
MIPTLLIGDPDACQGAARPTSASPRMHAALDFPCMLHCLLPGSYMHVTRTHARNLRAVCWPCLHPHASLLTHGHACHPSMHAIWQAHPARLPPWSMRCDIQPPVLRAVCSAGCHTMGDHATKTHLWPTRRHEFDAPARQARSQAGQARATVAAGRRTSRRFRSSAGRFASSAGRVGRVDLYSPGRSEG